jgi:ERCC4-type nuclease
MRLTYWTAGTLHRIYATGVEGTIGKTYFTVANRRLTVIADDFTLPKPHIIAATLAWLGLPETTSGQDAFDALKERSTPPRGTPQKLAPQPGSPSSGSSSFTGASTAPITRLGMAELSFTNIRNERPITIEVDHREPPEIDAFLAQVENCTVTRTTLEVADFRLNGTILVERKAASDFKLSVEDGRLFDQAQRIGFTQDAFGIVLLEGDVFLGNPGMLYSATTGAISCLSMIQGLSVINTLDLRHTCFVVAKFAQHHVNGLGYELPLRKDKPKQLFSAASYVLEGVPGVSAGLAAQLLRHFGSLQAVANASEADLKQVKGIGPKTAASIAATFAASTSS